MWLGALALGAIASSLLPGLIFCLTVVVVGGLAVGVGLFSSEDWAHMLFQVVTALIALQVGYGFGFAILAVFSKLRSSHRGTRSIRLLWNPIDKK
jgi:hypothetical protein